MDSFDDLWQAVLDRVKTQVSDTAYSLWISTMKFVDFKNSTVYLEVSNILHFSVIVSEYEEKVNEAFNEVLGFRVDLKLLTADSGEPIGQPDDDELEPHLVDYKNLQFTFENFIVGNSNKFAYAAAKAVAADPGARLSHGNNFNNYNPLFIYGNSGLGKTHLLNAISNEIKEKFPDMNIVYVRAEEFTNELVLAIQNKTTDEFHNKYRKNIDVLLVDDIQFISGKEATVEEFFHTFDTLIYNGAQIVLSSDRPPKEIRSITDRLRSRFEDGLIADIQIPEFETRREIIKRKAKLVGFDIPDNIVDYIAENIKSNIRQLEGVTKRLYAHCQFGDHVPTIALAKTVIKLVTIPEEPIPVTISRICEEVSRMTGVSMEDIRSPIRKANVSHARKITFYVIRNVLNLPYEDIGEQFNKHHSSVMYNVQELEKELDRDPKLERQVKDIINNIKSTL
ncbi:MAG: chromosomal replication initiator protein DnaA [Eubacterium sp.]|nr:chromosomal replication initiator protein DnaA [Eubacterium sp.]